MGELKSRFIVYFFPLKEKNPPTPGPAVLGADAGDSLSDFGSYTNKPNI